MSSSHQKIDVWSPGGTHMTKSSKRRRFLATLGTGSLALAAGCTDQLSGSSENSSDESSNNENSSADGADEQQITPPAIDHGDVISNFDDDFDEWFATEGELTADEETVLTGSQTARIENTGATAEIARSFPDGLDMTGKHLSLAVQVDIPRPARVTVRLLASGESDQVWGTRTVLGTYTGWLRMDVGYTGQRGEPLFDNVQELRISFDDPNAAQANRGQGNQGNESQRNQNGANQGNQSSGNQGSGNQGNQSNGNQSSQNNRNGNQGGQSNGNQSNQGSGNPGSQSNGNQGNGSRNQGNGNQNNSNQGNGNQGNNLILAAQGGNGTQETQGEQDSADIRFWVDDLRTTTAADQGYVMLTFDDAVASQYENAFPLFEERGMQAVAAVGPDSLNREKRLAIDHLREMRDAGWDISSHPEGPAFREFNDPEAIQQDIEDAREYLDNRGFPEGARHMFVPYHNTNEEIVEITREYHELSSYFGGSPNAVPFTDPMHLSRVNMSDLDAFTSMIDIAAEYNQLAIGLAHGVVPKNEIENDPLADMTTEQLEKLLTYIEKSDAQLVTASDLVDNQDSL